MQWHTESGRRCYQLEAMVGQVYSASTPPLNTQNLNAPDATTKGL